MATRFELAGEDEGVMDGTFTRHGIARPLRSRAGRAGADRYRVTGTVLQSAQGIKPYTAFLGALNERDAVDIEAEAQVPAPLQAPQ